MEKFICKVCPPNPCEFCSKNFVTTKDNDAQVLRDLHEKTEYEKKRYASLKRIYSSEETAYLELVTKGLLAQSNEKGQQRMVNKVVAFMSEIRNVEKEQKDLLVIESEYQKALIKVFENRYIQIMKDILYLRNRYKTEYDKQLQCLSGRKLYYASLFKYISDLKKDLIKRSINEDLPEVRWHIQKLLDDIAEEKRCENKKQEYLALILEKQREEFEKRTEKLDSRKKNVIPEHINKKRELQKEIQHAKENYKLLTTRRNLEGAGFRTDLSFLKKRLQNVERKKTGKDAQKKLERVQKILGELETNISNSYCK